MISDESWVLFAVGKADVCMSCALGVRTIVMLFIRLHE